MKRLALSLCVITAALPLLAAACSRPVAEPEPPSSELQWKVSDFAPEGVDPWVPLIEARGDYVIINLPHWPSYRVLGLEISDGTLIVRTSIRDGARTDRLDGWPSSPNLDRSNLAVLEVAGLKDRGVGQVRVLGESGRVIAPKLGLPGAIAVAEDHAGTDFGGPPPFFSMIFDLTYGGERLVYYLGYEDSQTIDRAGSNAVSGSFVVDAVTGEVLEADLNIVPLGHTRGLATGCRLLDWTESGNILTAAGRSLLAYDPQGGLVHSVETKVDFGDLEFVVLDGAWAWFKGPQGCLAVDISTGLTRSGDCPAGKRPPGTRTRTYTEKSSTIAIEVDLGPVSARIEMQEDRAGERAQLVAAVTRGGVATPVDASVMEGYMMPQEWAVDPGLGTIYFSAQFYWPSYGNWATGHALGALDLQTGVMRRVALMPWSLFRLSPCGGYAVYGYRDRVLIIDLRKSG